MNEEFWFFATFEKQSLNLLDIIYTVVGSEEISQSLT